MLLFLYKKKKDVFTNNLNHKLYAEELQWTDLPDPLLIICFQVSHSELWHCLYFKVLIKNCYNEQEMSL